MAFEGLSEKLKNFGKKDLGSSIKISGTVGEFFKKNAFMKYLIPIMIFIIAIAVFLVMVFSDGTLGEDLAPLPSEGLSPTGDAAVILPNDTNVAGNTDPDLSALIKRDPLSEEILAKAKYIGCVIGASGSHRVAIISNGGIEYRLSVGESLGESSWQVAEITEAEVTFTAGGKTKTLKYSGR